MSILHIMTGSNYNVTTDYIRFINEEFDSNLHDLIIMDKLSNVPENILSYSNVSVINFKNIKDFFILYKEMYKSKKILLHSLNKTSFQFLLLLNYKLFKKIYWISWGADLYQWETKNIESLKYRIRNIIAYKIRKKIKYFVGIFPPDIKFFEKEFKTSAKTFYASYVSGLYNPLFKKTLNLLTLANKLKNGKCINIQIGHSCAPILNHIQVLNDLYKYKNENMRIFLPLSYGNLAYGDKVEQHANLLFGEKAVCIRKMMSKEDYMDFLSTIDIAVFNTMRQIGLGNISPMIYMGKKIFMPEDSVMYKHYRSLDINICNYTNINNLSFSDFTKPISMIEGKKRAVKYSMNKELKVKMWTEVFDY